jgi:hypothetical protein
MVGTKDERTAIGDYAGLSFKRVEIATTIKHACSAIPHYATYWSMISGVHRLSSVDEAYSPISQTMCTKNSSRPSLSQIPECPVAPK